MQRLGWVVDKRLKRQGPLDFGDSSYLRIIENNLCRFKQETERFAVLGRSKRCLEEDE